MRIWVDGWNLGVLSRTITLTLAGRRSSWQDRSCARFATGGEHADFSAQAGDDHAEDQGCNPGKLGAGVDGGGTLRYLRADGLEVAEAG